jgi:two-component system, cell cycle response regulator
MSGRILIVDDVATNRIVYRARLAAAFYEPMLATDGESCLAAAAEARPDLILLDLGLPDMSGHEVLRRLRMGPATRDIPVIVLTAATDSDTRLAAFAAGADDVIVKPAADQVLLARVRNLMRTRAESAFVDAGALAGGLAEAASSFEPSATVAMVTGHGDTARALLQDLSGQLRDRLVVLSRAQALADATAAPSGTDVPDVFIIHDDSGDAAGALRLVSELKSHQATRHSAVCIVGRAGEGEDAAIAFDLGADDVVGSHVTATELAVRTRSVLRRKRQGDRSRARIEDNLRLAMVDPLTGLHNRRFAAAQLRSIAARALEEDADFAVMVVDLDRFKTVNDEHGHAAGDAVLVEVAQRLLANLRDSDLVARIGGEEFLVVLPQSSIPEARLVAERLCEALDERPIRLQSGDSIRVTVSIGVAVSDRATRGAMSVDGLVEQADLALRESKGAGRNQVTYRLSAA